MNLVGTDTARAAWLRAAHNIYERLEELRAIAPQPPATKRRSE
jgi:hypothetical protein